MIKRKLFTILIAFLFSFASFAIEDSQIDGESTTLPELQERVNSLDKLTVAQLDYHQTTKLWKDLFNIPYSKVNGPRAEWESKRTELLFKAGNLRYQVIASDYLSLSTSQFIQDSLFELKIIPQRWIRIFEVKYQAIQEKGKENKGAYHLIRSLLPEILSTLLFILLPLLVLKLNSYLLKTMENVREDLSNPYRFTPTRRRMAIILQRVGPFIPLLLSILALNVFSGVIRKTIVAELDLLIPFILYYLYYKIFRQLVLNLFIVFSEDLQLNRGRQIRAKIYSAAKALGRFFFAALLSLHLVSSVAGKGLLYQELYLLLWVCGAILYIWLVRSWSPEIDHQAKKAFTGKILAFYEKATSVAILNFIIRTITFLYLLLLPLFRELKEKFLEVGVGKAIFSKVFQRKLESNENLKGHEEAKLPEEYKEWFGLSKDDDDALWIKSKNQRLDEITSEVDEWLKDLSEEHSLAIYGDKGIGKTQIIRHLEKELQGHELKPEVIVASVPPKITSKNEVFKFLGNLVAGEALADVFGLLDFDKKLVEEDKKLVVILDDAHNFFLTHFGGLKGIEAFFEALNLRTDNIFWVAAFNTYSWAYLEQVFHKNKYFRTVFRLKGFNDEELQEYILKRHERSGYSLSYADIIRAVKTKSATGGDFSYVENMFFRLLWDQSQGNPELAEKLWLRALKPLYGKRLKVGLPLTHDLSVLKGLADEAFFVFAALMRHENLTTNEFIQVTDMKEGLVRHSLRIGLENNFIKRDETSKRYSFLVEGQYHVLNILKAKNFVYF